MQQDKIIKKIAWIMLGIFLFVAVVLAIVSFIDYSLVIGWVYGGVASIISWAIGILLIKLTTNKAKRYASGFWLGMGRWFLQMVFHIGMFFVLIIVDQVVHGHAPLAGEMSDLMSPINFYTYIAGLALSGVSTLVAHILKKKGE